MEAGIYSPFDLSYTPEVYLSPEPASLWALGDLANFTNCMGADQDEGEVVRNSGKYHIVLKRKNGEEVICPTSLLKPPTGKRWPHARPKPKVVKMKSSHFQMDLFG